MSSDNRGESEETPMEQAGDSGSNPDNPGGGESTVKCQKSADAKESQDSQQTEQENSKQGDASETQCRTESENHSSESETKMEAANTTDVKDTAAEMETSSTDIKDSTTVSSNGTMGPGEGNVDSSSSSGDAAAAVSKGELVDLKVMYNKKKYDVRIGLESTVAELKTEVQAATGVPPSMQKLMFKGLMKDEKTLKDLNVTSGAKLMLIGSTPKAVQEVTKPVGAVAAAEEEKATTSKEPLSTQKMHKKVLDKGKPDDAMIGIKNRNDPLPNVPVSGMMNKAGGKVRLTFKLELDQVWIGTKERTEKIHMNSIKNVLSEPIEGHEDYHMLAIQLGPTEASRYWIYWVPAQYAKAIKDTILGKWVYF